MIRQDHDGEPYTAILARFHSYLAPRNYLEIGTETGVTLELATCKVIAVDPKFQLYSGKVLGNKPICHLYQMNSDEFFLKHRPDLIFGEQIDLAFLDGMHRSEFLLRDFFNTERFCKKDSVILLHDCIPLDESMTQVDGKVHQPALPHRKGWWTGDVWRTVRALKRFRPDLQITAYDAPLTGLIAVTNLDPDSEVLSFNYDAVVKEMISWHLDLDSWFSEISVESTSVIDTPTKVGLRFKSFA